MLIANISFVYIFLGFFFMRQREREREKVHTYIREPFESSVRFTNCPVYIWRKYMDKNIIRPFSPLAFFTGNKEIINNMKMCRFNRLIRIYIRYIIHCSVLGKLHIKHEEILIYNLKFKIAFFIKQSYTWIIVG